jgi:hypothetical protein
VECNLVIVIQIFSWKSKSFSKTELELQPTEAAESVSRNAFLTFIKRKEKQPHLPNAGSI